MRRRRPSAPSARGSAPPCSGRCCRSGRSPSAPRSCRTSAAAARPRRRRPARATRRRRARRAGRRAPPSRKASMNGTCSAICLHLSISRSPPNAMSALAPVWLMTAPSCDGLNIGGTGASTAPRCMQAASTTAACERVAAEHRDDVARLHEPCGQPRGERDRRALELRVGQRSLAAADGGLVRGARRARAAKSVHRSSERQWPSA